MADRLRFTPNAAGHPEILGDLATDSSWQPMSRGLPHRFGPSIALLLLLLDRLAKPTCPGGFQFFRCAQPIERISCVSFDIERNVPAWNLLTMAILRDEAHPETLAARKHILFASVIRAGR